MATIFKKNVYSILVMLFTLITFLSCQKDINDFQPNPVPAPDFQTKVNSSVSGFVTDENNEAVTGATVKMGTSTTITDSYGYFEINHVNVIKNAAVVTVLWPGYFKGIKTFMAEEGKSAFFRIKLIPKTIEGTITSTTGGNVTLTNGMSITLPANAVVNASSGVAYSGNINVSAYWINPVAADLQNIMPGDLRGLDETGGLKQLTTYGMAAVELTGSGGEALQIATGSKATLTMPVPSVMAGSAPASIPLWYFDENLGLWKQEGTAVKTGNTYVGEVSHFSFWNCDLPNTYVQFNCTIIDANGNPVQHAWVKISVVSNPFNAAYGYTNSSGYVAGAVPDNAQLLLEVFSAYQCNTPSYSQTFSTTSSNISLGNIIIPAISTAVISGTVTDCSNNPVTDGYAVLQIGYQNYRQSLSNTGAFNMTVLFCSNTTTAVLIAEDNINLQQSTPMNLTISQGANAVGNLQACGVSIQQFINLNINGTSHAFTYPADSIYNYSSTPGTNFGISVQGYSGNNYANINFSNIGIGLNTSQELLSFSTSYINDSTVASAPISVLITEYGAVGEFISGNFSGVFIGAPPASINYNVSASFRVRRRM